MSFTNNSTGVGNFDGLWLGFDNLGAALWNEESTSIRMGTDGIERIRITDSGNVGLSDFNSDLVR